jgi:hypothetical protein
MPTRLNAGGRGASLMKRQPKALARSASFEAVVAGAYASRGTCDGVGGGLYRPSVSIEDEMLG